MRILFLLISSLLFANNLDTLSSSNLLIKTRQIGIYSLQILNDSIIYSFGGDGSIIIFNINSQKSEKIDKYSKGAILSSCYIPNKNVILTGGWDGNLQLFDIKTTKSRILYNSDKTINNIVYIPTHQLIFISSEDKSTKIFYLDKNLNLKLVSLAENQDYTSDNILFDKKNHLYLNFINSIFGCELQIYSENAELKKIVNFDNSIYASTLYNDTLIIVGDEYGNIHKLDPLKYELSLIATNHTNRITKMINIKNYIITTSWDNKIIFYDILNNKLVKEYYLPTSWISDIAQLDEKIFISTMDGSVYKINLP